MRRDSSFCAKCVRYNIFTNGAPCHVVTAFDTSLPDPRKCYRENMKKVWSLWKKNWHMIGRIWSSYLTPRCDSHVWSRRSTVCSL